VTDDQLDAGNALGRYLEILAIETPQRLAAPQTREHLVAHELGHFGLIVSLAQRASVG
jgi:hypothetical protein